MAPPDSGKQPWMQRVWQLLPNFLLHCATGVITVMVHYGLMYLALGFGVIALVATSIGFVGGALARFLMSYHHVFTPSRSRSSAAMHFMVSLGIQFLLNALVFSSLLALGIAVWPAQLITTVALTFINYGMYRLWVFA